MAVAQVTSGNNTGTNTSAPTIDYDPTGTNQTIIVWIVTGAPSASPYAAVSSVADTGGLTWARRGTQQQFDTGTNKVNFDVWWANAPTDTIMKTVTFTLNNQADAVELGVVQYSGVFNPAAPFDNNAGLPYYATNNTASATTVGVTGVTTTQSNDKILELMGSGVNNGAAAVAATYAAVGGAVQQSGDDVIVATSGQDKSVVAAQSSATHNFNSSKTRWVCYVDALTSDDNTAVVTITGSASMTLAAMTQALSGTESFTGTSSMTFGRLTQALSGTVSGIVIPDPDPPTIDVDNADNDAYWWIW